MNINYLIEKFDCFINKSRKHSAIQIYDDRRIFVEVCLSVQEFNENLIKLELASSYIIVTGLKLNMRNFNKYGIEINGLLHSINFEEK